MTTWCGAIVECSARDLDSLAGRYGITVTTPPAGAWAYVVGDVNLAHVVPPRFARELSAELGATVIAFMIQTTASCERIEHWERGELVRSLECVDGRWTGREGSPQSWEATYFFDSTRSTSAGEAWPLELDDELSEEDCARYERARQDGDPSVVLDLLRGGSVWAMRRVLELYGLDPNVPNARYAVPTNWKPWVVLGVGLLFVAGMAVLGALSPESAGSAADLSR